MIADERAALIARAEKAERQAKIFAAVIVKLTQGEESHE